MTEPAQPLPVAEVLDLGGRVVLVTGGGRGIGAAISERLAEAGSTVVVGGTDERPAGDVVRRIEEAGGAASIELFDVSDESAVDAAFDAVVARHGRLDGLVCCAGVQPMRPLLEQSAATWDAMMGVNARGVFLCTQAAARRMIAGGHGGAVVNIASIEGLAPAPDHTDYGVSKAAVLMHTKAAALELGRHGVRVNAVSPGLIRSETLAQDWPDGVARWNARVPLGRLGEGRDVADAVLFLLSPMASFVTGANLVVDGGILSGPTW